MTKATTNDTSTTDNVVQAQMKFKKPPVQNYDSKDTKKLLGMIFHDLEEGEHALTFASYDGAPRMPNQDLKSTCRKIDTTKSPHAFYFGTSSVIKAPDGKIYNRKAQFAALHVLVLDDIGTKIPLDSIPEGLIPNYIIESSKGNFQYGFILKEPLRDVALADALVHLVYTSGFGDEGGKIVTKAVRLPAGVNGKIKTDKYLDPVKLISCNENYWEPDDLLFHLNVSLSWDEVVADPSKVVTVRARGTTSTSPWSGYVPVAETSTGLVDGFLEWHYENDLVLSDPSSDWVVVKCPWSETHTDGVELAAYSPLGRGGADFENQRGFSCKHEHCKMHKTADYLAIMIKDHGAPEVPIFDPVAHLVRDWVFDSLNNTAIRIGIATPYALPMAGFRNKFNRKVTVYMQDGTQKRIAECTLWETAINRVNVDGEVYDSLTPSVLTIDTDGRKRVNLYVEPPWGDGRFEQSDVDKFLELAHYLMPNEDEYNYVMGWLSAKVSDRTFKGNAILMVATTQGIGRSLFCSMITDLFTHSNCSTVPFPQMIGDAPFNEWQASQMVFCDEVMTDSKKLYSSYERLKDILDPRPKLTAINVKYGGKFTMMNYASYLLLTNKAGAVGALQGDRRIYVVTNPQIRQEPSYYAGIEKWRNKLDSEGHASWIKNVWRWLRKQPYDLEMLNKPVPETRGKEIMRDETDGIEEKLIRWCFENVAPCMPTGTLKELITLAAFKAEIDHELVLGHFSPAVKNMTLNAKAFKYKQRVNAKPATFRISTEAVAAGRVPSLVSGDPKQVNYAITDSAKALTDMYEDKAALDRVITELAEIITDVV